MFDPEKVRNYTANNIQFANESAGTHWVLASDYDQLLELYREAHEKWRQLIIHPPKSDPYPKEW
jgi:hypothetical protein